MPKKLAQQTTTGAATAEILVEYMVAHGYVNESDKQRAIKFVGTALPKGREHNSAKINGRTFSIPDNRADDFLNFCVEYGDELHFGKDGSDG